MPLIEYMLEKTREGDTVPSFVDKHIGHANGRSFVGYVRPSNQRNHYVPSTVKVFDKETFVARHKELIRDEFLDQNPDSDETDLINACEELYDSLMKRHGE